MGGSVHPSAFQRKTSVSCIFAVHVSDGVSFGPTSRAIFLPIENHTECAVRTIRLTFQQFFNEDVLLRCARRRPPNTAKQRMQAVSKQCIG